MAAVKMDYTSTVAYEAFRAHVRKQYAADIAEKEMLAAVAYMAKHSSEESRAEYHRLTAEVLAEDEAKREKAGL